MTTPTTASGLEARALTRRYLVIHGLRWLPTGLLIPITVLLFTSRGLSLTEYGVIGTVMAVTTFLLEVPTGGLADTLGRRRVLLVAGGFVLVAKGLLVVVATSSARPTMWLVLVAMASLGVYRALESGPLDAWFVDAMHAIDPGADIEAGLGKAGTVTGFAIAAGSLLAGGIMALDPVPGLDPMAVVLVASILLVVAQLVAIVTLMVEVRPPSGDGAGLVASLAEVPTVIASTLSLLRASRVLALLLVVEATWSVGMVAFENLFPVRIETLAGSTEQAAALLGPVSAAAWAASGLGAGLVVRLSRRLGPWRAGTLLRLLQAATIVGMGLIAGIAGVIAAFVATYMTHGASGPVHLNLVHAQVSAGNRTTALSLNSMTAFAAFSVAGIGVGAIADAASVPVAMLVCAAITALGAAGYVAAGRADGRAVPGPVEPVEVPAG